MVRRDIVPIVEHSKSAIVVSSFPLLFCVSLVSAAWFLLSSWCLHHHHTGWSFQYVRIIRFISIQISNGHYMHQLLFRLTAQRAAMLTRVLIALNSLFSQSSTVCRKCLGWLNRFLITSPSCFLQKQHNIHFNRTDYDQCIYDYDDNM